MTNDKPPVAPIERHYAMLRNGMIARPQMSEWPEDPAYLDAYLEIYWDKDGKAQPATKAESDVRHAPKYDIIATISPEAMNEAAALSQQPSQEELSKGRVVSRFEWGDSQTENLVKLAGAVLDHADAHCRAFPIATAPTDRRVSFWNSTYEIWEQFKCDNLKYLPPRYTHWAEPLPPPSKPPLPDVFTQLGQALEKIKGAG
jgi:hypothetical protein